MPLEQPVACMLRRGSNLLVFSCRKRLGSPGKSKAPARKRKARATAPKEQEKDEEEESGSEGGTPEPAGSRLLHPSTKPSSSLVTTTKRYTEAG